MDRKVKIEDEWDQQDLQASKSPRKKAKVCLKAIEIKIEDEKIEVERDGVWLDVDELQGNEPSFHNAHSQLQDKHRNMNQVDPKVTQAWNGSSICSGGQARSNAEHRRQKRIIWGEEVPCSSNVISLDLEQTSSLVIQSLNPLITIRPAAKNEKNKSDIVIKSGPVTTSFVVNSSNRVVSLDKLRNYIVLSQPDCTGAENLDHSSQQYFLSLLDPSMPRLTNCGMYYRMRYAVYVLLSTMARQGGNTVNWRKRRISDRVQTGKSTGQSLLLHIGEMHLYNIFPKDGKLQHSGFNEDQLPRWCKEGKSSYIHYENISFFVNQSSLSREEETTLRVTESDINQMTHSFRRYLNSLNSIGMSLSAHSADQFTYSSNFLLEQLKYPKSSDHFINSDRTCEQFVRNQVEMFARYEEHFADKKQADRAGTSLDTPVVKSKVKLSIEPNKKSKDLLTGDSFVASLFRLNNQSSSGA